MRPRRPGVHSEPKRRTNFTGLTPIVVNPVSTGNLFAATLDAFTWENRGGPYGVATSQLVNLPIASSGANAGKANFDISARYAYFRLTLQGAGELVDVVVHSNPAGVD